jgi:anti-anti-sigma factor
MSELARIEVATAGRQALVRVHGEIDLSNARDLSAAIEGAVRNDIPTLVIDLTEATYLDSTGVQLLFILAERLRTRRHELRLIVPKEAPIRAVLELTGLASIVAMEPSFDPGASEDGRPDGEAGTAR